MKKPEENIYKIWNKKTRKYMASRSLTGNKVRDSWYSLKLVKGLSTRWIKEYNSTQPPGEEYSKEQVFEIREFELKFKGKI